MDQFYETIKVLANPKYMAGFISIMLVFVGYRIAASIKKDSPLAPYILQILGMLFILPVVMLVSTSLDLSKESVSGLLGTIVGYVFGTSRLSESKTGKSSNLPVEQNQQSISEE